MTQTLYSLRTHIDVEGHSGYFITKFVDGEVESAYTCTETECTCPAGHRPSCRHRQMLPELLARGLVNTHWFWDFDRHHAVDFEGTPKADYDNVANRQTFTIPDGYTAIRDADGRATGELAPIPDLPPNHSAQSGDSIGRITSTRSWRRL